MLQSFKLHIPVTRNKVSQLTSLPRAEMAVPLLAGSIESRESKSAKAEGGKSLKVSATQRLY